MKFKNSGGEWQTVKVKNYGIEQTPIGSMIYYPSLNIPNGYLVCDGREVLIADYPLLFNAIGYIGGDDVDTGYFRLPDMQGVVPGGFNPNLVGTTHSLAGDFGDQVGSPTHTLTIEEMPSHDHGFRAIKDYINTDSNGTSGIAKATNAAGENTGYTNYSAESISNTGGGQAHSIVQPTKLYHWLIKAKNVVTLGGYTEDFEITGKLIMPRNSYWVDGKGALDMNNSDIIRANSIFFQDEADSEDEGLHFPKSGVFASRDINDYDTFRIRDGVMYLNNNKVGRYICDILAYQITTKGVHTLSTSIDNYDEIRIWATTNTWYHRLMCNTYKWNLSSSYVHIIQYTPDVWDSNLYLYGTTLDTSTCENFETNEGRIFRVEGIKYHG